MPSSVPEGKESRFRYCLMVIALAALYYVSAQLGLALAFEKTNASPVWPPSGIAFAAVLFFGYRLWPGIAIGAFLGNVTVFFSYQVLDPPHILIASSFLAIGNTLEAVTGAFLLRRFTKFRKPLERIRDLFKYFAVTILMCLISAGIGPASLCLLKMVPWALYGTVWFTWWLGDVMGVIIVTSFILAWSQKLPRRWEFKNLLEVLFFLALLLAVVQANFGKLFSAWGVPQPLPYLFLPLIVWAALRFGQRGVTASTFLISAFAVWGTINGTGPFVGETRNESLLLLQTFVGTISVTGLTLAAVLWERRQAKEGLARLAAIVEFSEDAIIGKTLKGIIVSWNRGAERLYGYEAEEVIGKPITILVPPDHPDEISKILERLKRGEHIEPYETTRVKKDGTKIHVSLSISPIKNELGKATGASAIARDITERKQLEAKQDKLLQELKNANQELNDFARAVSHDLKAPLQGISALADLLFVGYKDKLDDKAQEFLRLLGRRVKLMHALIDGILEYSRAGFVREKVEPVNLNKIVNNTIVIIAPPENIKIRVEGELPVLQGERFRIQQVFQNLLSNAVKYISRENGEVKIACVPEGDFWKFSVSDNGPGINEKYFGKIFQMFQTLQPKSRSGSSGIGLPLVKKIVEMYGGKIWVESREGEGSTFFFTLPKNHNV